MKISLSVIGKLDYYQDELNKIGIKLNDIAIPAIGNPNTPKNQRYDVWEEKMKKSISSLLKYGIKKTDILINTPINQIINKNIKEIDKLSNFLIENEITKIVVIRGNGNMGKSKIKVKDFVSELRKKLTKYDIKIYVALYPSHKLSWSKEVLGKCTLLDNRHLNAQKIKINKLNDLVDGYMTQITVNGIKSAQWLNMMYKNTDKPIFLGISAPTHKKLDIMHIRTQLNYLCNDEKFLLDDSMSKIILRVLKKPNSWFKILNTMNLGILDMMWRFKLTRMASFEKLIDDLRLNVNKNHKIHIHFNSGGQSPVEAMKYIRQLEKLKTPLKMSN